MHENAPPMTDCVAAKGGMILILRKKKTQPVKHDIQRLCDFSHQSEESNSDVLGSYTGTPKDGGRPVQDADDL